MEVGRWGKGADGWRREQKRVGGAGLQEAFAVPVIRM